MADIVNTEFEYRVDFCTVPEDETVVIIIKNGKTSAFIHKDNVESEFKTALGQMNE